MTTTAAIVGWGVVDVTALALTNVVPVRWAVGLIPAGVIVVGLGGYRTYRATKAVSTCLDYHTVRTGRLAWPPILFTAVLRPFS
jgi:hypothetical protein